MRIASKNRFSRLVIKKVWYTYTSAAVNQHTSITKDQTIKNFKPAIRAVQSCDASVKAGTAL